MPNPLCDLFPPEFRYQCDPYCAACAPQNPTEAISERHALHAHAGHHHHTAQQHLEHLEVLEDPDLRPYIWEL